MLKIIFLKCTTSYNYPFGLSNCNFAFKSVFIFLFLSCPSHKVLFFSGTFEHSNCWSQAASPAALFTTRCNEPHGQALTYTSAACKYVICIQKEVWQKKIYQFYWQKSTNKNDGKPKYFDRIHWKMNKNSL